MDALRGRRIAVTREEEADGPLSTLLREAGALPLPRPTVEMAPLLDPQGIRRALAPLPEARWLVVTSPRAVGYLAEAGVFGEPPPPGLRVAAVGPSTAEAVAGEGWPVHLVPAEARGEPLLEAILEEDDAPGGLVVFPASGHARDVLPEGLEGAGYEVLRVALYEPRDVPRPPDAWAEDLDQGLAGIVFSSPSAVKALGRTLGDDPVGRHLRRLPAAAQGPVTGQAVRAAGWERVKEAEPHTFPGVVAAMAALLTEISDPAVSEVNS